MDIAIIPARGGSKRIPRKNIKPFCGKPMLHYSIDAALTCGRFDEVIISTDDEEIRDSAIQAGAKALFLRPDHLSDDFTPTVPVIAHAITECERYGWQLDYVSCIYAAAPFIDPHDFGTAIDLVKDRPSIYSFPVCEHASPIQRALVIDENASLSPMFPENELIRTQDLTPTYFDVGQFYTAHKDTWLTNTNIHHQGRAIIIPKWRAVDIDDLDDWYKAERLYQSYIMSKTTKGN